jgi:AraC-like DNA-binding protein
MKNQILKELNIDVHVAHFVNGANNSNHKIPWRRLYDYELIFVVDGEITVKTKSETYTVKKNQLHIMPPFTYHARYFEADAQCSYYGLHLDFFNSSNEDFSVYDAYIVKIKNEDEFIEKEAWLNRKNFEGIKVPPVVDIRRPKQLETLFKPICKNSNKKKNDKYLEILLKSNAYAIVHHILQECEANGQALFSYNKNLHADIIADFTELVQKEYMHEIDLDQITFEYGLSKNHFAKIFKQAMNLAPHDYLIAYRLEKAKELLKSGKYYVNEVAAMVGYPNYAYFSRLFKSKEGVSPQNYLLKNEGKKKP